MDAHVLSDLLPGFSDGLHGTEASTGPKSH